MQTTQNTPIGGGWSDPAATPAVDDAAPVEQPRRCGMCQHFERFPRSEAHPRAARFGRCHRWDGITADEKVAAAETDPTDRGPLGALLGDLFGCVFFEARKP